MSVHFRPVRSSPSVQQVVDQIQQSIRDGHIPKGSRLSSVNDLAAQFGISRATVREALRVLSALGFVEVKHGRGIFVAQSVASLEDPRFWLPWLEAHREDVIALLEVREALEVKSAALAAARVARDPEGTSDQVEAIEENVARMVAAAGSQDLSLLERVDLEFHAMVARLAASPYLVRLCDSINHVFGDRRAVMSLPGRPGQSAAQHREIVNAIRRGDAAAATEAMGRHLQSTIASVRELRTGDTVHTSE